MTIVQDFQDLLRQSYADSLREILARNPTTTTAELEQLVADHPSLAGLTLGELLEAKPARPSPPPKPRARPQPPPKPQTRPRKVWNPRTQQGRDALDTAVYVALREAGPQNVAAGEIRAAVGAKPLQLRAALNRLIEAGKVSYTGQARGTRYSIV